MSYFFIIYLFLINNFSRKNNYISAYVSLRQLIFKITKCDAHWTYSFLSLIAAYFSISRFSQNPKNPGGLVKESAMLKKQKKIKRKQQQKKWKLNQKWKNHPSLFLFLFLFLLWKRNLEFLTSMLIYIC